MKLAATTDLLIPDADDLGLALHRAAENGLSGVAVSLTPTSPFHMGNLKTGDVSFLKEARHHGVEVMCLYGLTLFGKEPEAAAYLYRRVTS